MKNKIISILLMSNLMVLGIVEQNGQVVMPYASDMNSLMLNIHFSKPNSRGQDLHAIMNDLKNSNQNLPSDTDVSGNTALHYAVRTADPAIVGLLLNNGYDQVINTPNQDGETPLHMIASFTPKNSKELVNQTKIIDKLKDSGASLYKRDNNWRAPGDLMSPFNPNAKKLNPNTNETRRYIADSAQKILFDVTPSDLYNGGPIIYPYGYGYK